MGALGRVANCHKILFGASAQLMKLKVTTPLPRPTVADAITNRCCHFGHLGLLVCSLSILGNYTCISVAFCGSLGIKVGLLSLMLSSVCNCFWYVSTVVYANC